MTQKEPFEVHVSNENTNSWSKDESEMQNLPETVWSADLASHSSDVQVGLVKYIMSSYVDSFETKCDVIWNGYSP